MSTDTSEPIIPSMGAEGGFGLEDEAVAPLRVSGFICLILGLLSPLAYLGLAMMAIPIVAILVGLFALRRHGDLVPVGLGAARVGVVMSAGFGLLGVTVPMMKKMTLASQAEKFARDYIEVIALDEVELAMELRKDHVNRYPSTMPLKAHYKMSQAAEDLLIEFRNDGINDQIRERGPGAPWKLLRPVRIYTHYQFQMADLVLVDPTGKSSIKLHMILEYRIDRVTGDGQWHVNSVQHLAKPIYAPLVL